MKRTGAIKTARLSDQRHWLRIKTFLLAAWFALSFTCRGQEDGKNSDCLVRTWLESEGIPDSSVLSTAQTSDGYIWVGTSDGLLRFNGTEFTHVASGSVPPMLSQDVDLLHTDRSGRLWVGSLEGTALWDRGSWTLLAGTNVLARTIGEDANGRIIIGGREGNVFTVTNHEIQPLSAPAGLTPSGVFSLEDARDGGLWLANRGFIGRPDANGWRRFGPSSTLRFALVATPAKSGGIWTYSGGQLRHYHADGKSETFWAPWVDDPRTMIEDQSGAIWIGSTSEGITRFVPGTQTSIFITATNGLIQNSIWCLLQDKEGNIWAGGSIGGLNRLRPRRFVNIDQDRGLPNQVVESVTENTAGEIVAATHGSGTVRIKNDRVIPPAPASQNRLEAYVWSVLGDRAGRTWTGTFDHGLFVEQNGVEHSVPLPPSLGRSVQSLMEDSHGRIWVGTLYGVGIIEDGSAPVRIPNPGLEQSIVTGMAEDPRSGAVWLGTFNQGLLRLDGNQLTRFGPDQGIPVARITSVAVDSAGYVWVGIYNQGLVCLHAGKVTAIGPNEGLPAETVGSVIEDGLGWIWMGSNRGILRAPADQLHRLASGETTSVSFNVFDKNDGLDSADCIEGCQPAAVRDHRGHLYFATLDGVVAVDPKNIPLNTNPPPVIVERVEFIDESGVNHMIADPGNGRVTIPPGASAVQIFCTALNYTAASKTRFAYRFEGPNAKWVNVGNRGVLYFHRLEPGHFVLDIKAANNDGVWNETGARLSLDVRPFPWDTLWFRCLAIVAAVGGVCFGAWRITYGNLKRRIASLEQQRALEAERARLATVMEGTSDLVAFATNDGRLIHINPAGRKLVGLVASDDITQLKLSDLQPRWAAERIIREGIPAARKSGTWEAETALLHQDGHEIPVSQVLIAHPGPAGTGGFLSTVARDLTQRQAAERALRESEERYRRIAQCIPDVIWTVDLSGRFTYVNPAVERTQGRTVEEFLALKFQDFLAPAHAAQITAAIQAKVDRTSPGHDRGKVYFFEGPHYRKDGSEFWAEVSASFLWNDDGSPSGIIGITRDVTERRQAQAALHEKEIRYRTLFESANDAILIMDEQVFQDCNHRALLLYGCTRDELVGRSPVDFSPEFQPDSRPSAEKAREKIAAALGGRQQSFEWRHQRPDRTLFDCEVGLNCIVLSGKPCLLAIVRDITERKQAEAELQRREKYFRLLIENAYESITVVDAKAVVIYQSASGERVLGYPAESMIGRSLFDLVHPEDLAKARAGLNQSLASASTPVTLMIRLRHRDGSWRTIETSGTSVQPDGGEIQIILNSRDVTDKLELETQFRQAQKMDAIGQLAGGVAHDFNNILMALLVQIDLATMTENLPQSVREGLDQMRADTRRAADLTRRLLLFGRRQVMQSRHLDLNEVVRNITQMLQRIIGEDVRLQLNLHPAPLLTNADAGMLDQVLMNLAVNARDAMPQGGWMLVETSPAVVGERDPRLGSSLDAAPGRYVCFSVCDTGSGIPPEILHRIFEPFFTTKEAGKGTGLGLATVFGIVKQHQGWVHVDNRPGQGATFQIFLPAVEGMAAEAPVPAPKTNNRGGSETVLLVEDEPAVRQPTRRILEWHGYRVLEAADALEALKLWREHKAGIALLLTDLVMPGGIGGRELGRRLAAERPDLKIVFVSGYSADIAGQDFQLQPGEMFVEKPFGTEQLLDTVRRCLDS